MVATIRESQQGVLPDYLFQFATSQKQPYYLTNNLESQEYREAWRITLNRSCFSHKRHQEMTHGDLLMPSLH